MFDESKFVGRYTNLKGNILKDIVKSVLSEDILISEMNDEEKYKLADSIIDDVVRMISQNNLLNTLFDNVAQEADIDAIASRVAKEKSVTDVFSSGDIKGALSSSEHLTEVDTKDVLSYVRDTYQPSDVFSSKDLEDWATSNGYELSLEERIGRVHS